MKNMGGLEIKKSPNNLFYYLLYSIVLIQSVKFDFNQ